MKKETLLQIKEQLLLEKENLIKQCYNEFDLDDVDFDGDEIDEIQAKSLIGLHSKIKDRKLLKLSQISDALRKIENSEYGMCEDCDEPIAEKRLIFNPHFTTCVLCAEQREIDLRR